MKKARLAAQSRSQLDERFRELGPAKRYTPPVRGWIKALREALGMSTAQLAKRLGIKQPSLVALEQSEAKGTIELPHCGAWPRRSTALLSMRSCQTNRWKRRSATERARSVGGGGLRSSTRCC